MKYIATCKMGLESVVAQELENIGIEVIRKEDARVVFQGDFNTMATACIKLRAAERVLLVLTEFHAGTFSELFDNINAFAWKQYIARDSIIHVNGKSAKSTLYSVSDCQSITKKAIVENLKSSYRTTTIPETGNRIIVEVGILRDTVTIALDACGSGLSRRGYRLANYTAPIAESLAAGILLLSKYRGGIPLVDPMCGSGTIPIEAALIACNRAPGLNRAFAAEEWHFINRDCFSRAKEIAESEIIDVKPQIIGMDIDEHAIALSKRHAKNTGVMIDWRVSSIKEFTTPFDSQKGTIICNPPYGERMMERREAEILYKDMRTVFDACPPGWSKNIITSHIDFERIYGKRADKRRNLSNGGKRCTLYSYFK